jgi:triosephosphate isomerase
MIAGNWKMNKTYDEGVVLAQGLVDELKDGTGSVDVVVCPPAIDVKGVAEVIQQANAPIAVGVQNVYWEEKGAYTGETAPDMITAVGATYCIIGHSERRGYFGETDEDINKKAKALMAHGIVPISCCGESLEVREAGKHVEFVVEQIKKDTEGLDDHRSLQVRCCLRAHLGHRHRQDRHG